MLNIPQLLSTELRLNPSHVQNALALQAEGGTVPFIARYRKERTGEMDEVVLHSLFDRFAYLTELEERKQTVLRTIEEQGKLTEDLKAKIEACLEKTALEDLYLPFKPKKRTRATVAKEKGLEPLAAWIASLNISESPAGSLEEEAAKYVSEEKGVATAQDALAGASDILAEEVSEKAELRAYLRASFMKEGFFVSKIKEEFPAGSTKYEMYRDYKARVKDIHPHNMLALRRAEKEKVLTFELQFDSAVVEGYLESQEIKTRFEPLATFLRGMLKDAFDRLMKVSLETDVRVEKKLYADGESIKTFEANLRDLLLSSPAGMKPTMGIDPGFRTGCKVVIISDTAKFLEYETIFPHQSEEQRGKAADTVRQMIEKHSVELIAIGNGTASRETDEFVDEVLKSTERKPIKVLVNESGASVYSASRVAREEFPDLDLTVRGSISIARRLQDPLAELVKIDPKSIGVGQYQHDVDQKLLKKNLEQTVESCVNYVGVELNLASAELLKYVSGLTKTVAKNIVKYREDHGAFRNRQQLMEVPNFGPKAFEQAAGFLRIRGGEEPLDNTAVHPESYPVAKSILADLGVTADQPLHVSQNLSAMDIRKYVTETVGEPTLRDIVRELQKPGRDPRAEFRYARFDSNIKELKDLKPGMQLEGVVTNVANFGAFVDIGVHQDGLVHVSQLANRYVREPHKVVKVGQIVKVRVLEVNESLKRIALSMKSPESASPRPVAPAQRPSGEVGPEKKHEPRKPKREFPKGELKEEQRADRNREERQQGETWQKPRYEEHRRQKKHEPQRDEQHFSIEDLKAKFNSR